MTRTAFGARNSDQSVTQERIAEARIMIEQAKLLTLKAGGPPQRGLDAARPERRALAAAGRAAEGDHPGCRERQRPKPGDTAARAKALAPKRRGALQGPLEIEARSGWIRKARQSATSNGDRMAAAVRRKAGKPRTQHSRRSHLTWPAEAFCKTDCTSVN
jgi:hypothetical protein